MPRYFPTSRGWIAFLLALLASCLYPLALPPVYVESGVQTWLSERVSVAALIGGIVLVIVCFAACIEAFRRGTRADKVAASIAALLTVALMEALLRTLVLPVRPTPKQARPSAARSSNRTVQKTFNAQLQPERVSGGASWALNQNQRT